jgi:hypothetical protein
LEAALKTLREKDCYFMKADKDNSMVILDKGDYGARVDKLIERGTYTQLTKTPLPRMTRETAECLKKRVTDPKSPINMHLQKITNPEKKCVVEKVKDKYTNIGPNDILASFDVESLCPNQSMKHSNCSNMLLQD